MELQPSANQVLVIEKAIRLLDEFRSTDSLTLSELSSRLKMSKSTVHRLLSSLEQVGFVEREPQPGCYRLGMKLFELGSLVQSRMQLRQVALHYMTELVERTEETVFLTIRDGLRAVCIERIDGRHVQVLELKLGGSLPLHAGAGPRMLLAHAPSGVLEELLAHEPLRKFTPNTITEPEMLRADAANTRERGYCLSYEDVTVGVAALGVPLFDHTGRAVAALSLAGITPRWTEERMTELLVELRTSSAKISQRLGYGMGYAVTVSPPASAPPTVPGTRA